MDTTLKVFGGALAIVILLFTAPLLGVLGGAFGGWVVGIFFTDLIIGTLARFGVDTAGLAVWHLGAFLGFVCGFFKTYAAASTK